MTCDICILYLWCMLFYRGKDSAFCVHSEKCLILNVALLMEKGPKPASTCMLDSF